MLHQVYKNVQQTNFAQLVSKLCGQTPPPLRRNETHIFYNVNEPDNGNGVIVGNGVNGVMDSVEMEKNGWSIQEQLQEQQKLMKQRKFDVGSDSSLGTVVPT